MPSARQLDAMFDPCLNALHKFCDDWHAKIKTTLDDHAASSTLLLALSDTLALLAVDMNADDLMVELFKEALKEFRDMKEKN